MLATPRVGSVLCLCLLATEAATAAGFADTLRDYLLGTRAATSPLPAEEVTLDPASRECMGCHDGSRAGAVQVKAAEAPMRFAGSRSKDHPVGMDYAQYAMRKPQRYRPAASLDPSIRLVEGKVSCVSCHRHAEDPQAQAPGTSSKAQLARGGCTATGQLNGDSGSGSLCLACHAN